MVNLDQINRLLGEEFLTWLWFKSEEQNGLLEVEGETFALYFTGRVVVEGGEGEAMEKTVCSGEMSELIEAKKGLQLGKKVTQARIRLEQDSLSWQFNVKAEDFSLQSLKTPKIEMKVEQSDELEGRFLEKMYLIDKCVKVFLGLYAQFLELRFGPGWMEEVGKIRTWVLR